MIKSIVVPIDGSRLSERAIPVAARLAQAHQATMHLVLAQEPTAGLGPFGDVDLPSVLFIEELDRQHAAYLDRIANRLRKAGLRVKTVLTDGAAGRVIARTVQSAHAGLVVMSTHGRGAIGRLGMGSVCDYVVRHLEAPILVIPANARVPRGIAGRRVLVPLDLSPESGRVLDVIGDLMGTAPRLTLLNVIESVPLTSLPAMAIIPPTDASFTRLQWERAQGQMELLESKARRLGFPVTTRLMTDAPAAAILDQLHRGSYDLVAMTTHGYGGFKRLLLGSVTDKVIRNAGKPVLVIRPKARAPRSRKMGRRGAARK